MKTDHVLCEVQTEAEETVDDLNIAIDYDRLQICCRYGGNTPKAPKVLFCASVSWLLFSCRNIIGMAIEYSICG
jgi:hypothetical protein